MGNQKIREVLIEALEHRGWSTSEAEQIITHVANGATTNPFLETDMNELKLGPSDPIMPLGKYKGRRIGDIPYSYLFWILSQDWFEEQYHGLYKKINVLIRRADYVG